MLSWFDSASVPFTVARRITIQSVLVDLLCLACPVPELELLTHARAAAPALVLGHAAEGSCWGGRTIAVAIGKVVGG